MMSTILGLPNYRNPQNPLSNVEIHVKINLLLMTCTKYTKKGKMRNADCGI